MRINLRGYNNPIKARENSPSLLNLQANRLGFVCQLQVLKTLANMDSRVYMTLTFSERVLYWRAIHVNQRGPKIWSLVISIT